MSKLHLHNQLQPMAVQYPYSKLSSARSQNTDESIVTKLETNSSPSSRHHIHHSHMTHAAFGVCIFYTFVPIVHTFHSISASNTHPVPAAHPATAFHQHSHKQGFRPQKWLHRHPSPSTLNKHQGPCWGQLRGNIIFTSHPTTTVTMTSIHFQLHS